MAKEKHLDASFLVKLPKSELEKLTEAAKKAKVSRNKFVLKKLDADDGKNKKSSGEG